MTVKMFKSYEDYENWTEQFENCSDYQEIPCAIDDGFKVMTDMFTECKSWKTALRRFEKTFREVHSDITGWVECMREGAEGGYFKDECKPGWNATPEELKEFYAGGSFSYGIEEVDDGYWYIFLNISGIYASRECKVV